MNNWTTRALGKKGAEEEYTEEQLSELVVVLLEGKNTFGDPIYSYLQLTFGKMRELSACMRAGQGFAPSDFGTVIAAGKGAPSQELREEMAKQYNLVDVSRPPPPPPSVSIPKFWGEEDGA